MSLMLTRYPPKSYQCRLHKIWEPTLVHLLKSLTWSSPPAFDIAEIWVWEAVNHGDAGLVNAHHLSGLCESFPTYIYLSLHPLIAFNPPFSVLDDWQDNARDILHFLLSYLPSSPSQNHLPTHLDRIPQSLTDHRERVGFQNRSLVAVGHSFGGCSSSVLLLYSFIPTAHSVTYYIIQGYSRG